MPWIRLYGKIFASCQNGHTMCDPSAGPVEETEVTTNGCEGGLPQWHFERNNIHATSRGM